jgi:hypothetical protein
MKALLLIAAVGLVYGAASPHAADVPCEQLIKQLDDALKGSKITEMEKGKVMELRRRGVDECKAEKDGAADRDLREALKIVGK